MFIQIQAAHKCWVRYTQSKCGNFNKHITEEKKEKQKKNDRVCEKISLLIPAFKEELLVL